ncbi:MAG: autotransporter domain-containing protein [bacterium]|nr:autotransporter domain-containing protein [bacterium]
MVEILCSRRAGISGARHELSIFRFCISGKRRNLRQTLLFLLLFTTAGSAFSAPVFAQRQTAVGPGIIPLDATGQANGVDMSANAGTGTLSIGVTGGPQTDIFSSNNPVGTVAGLAVSTDVSSTSNIQFNSSSTVYGDIGVTNPGGPFFLDIETGAVGVTVNPYTVNFLGSVYGTTLNINGTGVVNFNSGSTNITTTNFAGDGTLSLAPNTTLIGALTSTAGADTGTLSLGNNSVLDGAVGGATGLHAINVVGNAGSANISGAVDSYSFSLGTNTLNIGGALTLANLAPGTIDTTISSPTLFGHIVPVGSASEGATTVNVTVAPAAYIPVGSQFDIVQATSGTSGSIVTVASANPLYIFSAPVTANGLVTIHADGTPLTTILPASASSAAGGVSAALAGIVAPTPDLLAVLVPINNLPTAAAVASALTQLAPSTPALAQPLLTFQATQQFQDLWLSRFDDLMCGQDLDPAKPSTCELRKSRSAMWIKGFGNFGDQGTRNGFAGYDSRVVGTMIGADTPIGDGTLGETRAGFGIGYARTSIDGKVFDANTDANTYQATAYIGHEHGPWFINGSASFGWNDYAEERHIVFPGVNRTAQADYSGQDYTAFAITGYHFTNPWFTLTPTVSLQDTYMNLDSYTESGAGNVNLRVNSQSYNFLQSGLGVKMARSFAIDGGAVVPNLHAKWLHGLNNPTAKNTAIFTAPGSPSFTTQGPNTADDTFNVGVGIKILSCACDTESWALEAVYDHDWRNDNYHADQVGLRLTRQF